MVAPLVAAAAAPVISAGVGAALGGFGKKKKRQVPLEPPEVTAARQALYNYSKTGTYGDFTAGAEVPLGYGDYNATGIENQGLSSLQQLLSSGIPGQFKMGDDALRGILDGSQAGIDAQFNPFKDQVRRQINTSNNDLKRSAGFAGNLYGTDTVKRLGDVQARGNETLASQLAALTNQAADRRLQAIPLAYQSAQGQENIAQGRIAASQQFGGLTRQLNDQRIKARDAELLRRRQELQLPIQAAQTVLGAAPQYGIPEINASPLNDLLGLVGQVGGQYFTNKAFLGAPKFTGNTVASGGYPYSYGNKLSL